ncbi:MAG: imidazoleglycerol-phosphate dehydratase [Clostridia bacterium]|jgi:imidazoleglycerol-phosphate dehydratase|nr:imidazoleglycerol-phosphate dehydratase [Clostridia bacterium]
MKVKVERQTLESKIIVILDDGPRDPESKKNINTPLAFFNHMIEQIAWRSELNIGINVELDHFFLNHVICEDVGITLGRACKELLEKKLVQGARGFGFALATIDEALAQAVLSFENRAFLDLNFHDISIPQTTEGIHSEDLVSFLEGFVQGAQCTLHIDLMKARPNHGHHQWESIFRAAGQAFREALEVRPWRSNMSAGVAGKIGFKVEFAE